MTADRYPTSAEAHQAGEHYRTPNCRPTLRLSRWLILGLVLIMAAYGWREYSSYSHCHRLSDPRYDLLVVDNSDPAELAFFRKKTNPEFVEPAFEVQRELVGLQASLEGGRALTPRECERLARAGDRLIEIMEGATLRQIPKVYQRQYDEVLHGIHDVYLHWCTLDLVREGLARREERDLLNRGRLHSARADKRLTEAAKFFHGRKARAQATSPQGN